MRVSVVQTNPGASKAADTVQATRLIDGAMEAGRPDLVRLPEVWTCFGGSRATKQAVEMPPAQDSNAPASPAHEFLVPLGRTRRDVPVLERRRDAIFGLKGPQLA